MSSRLACLGRIPLKAGAEHYGFYLAVPAPLGAAIFWSRDVGSFIQRLGGSRRPVYVSCTFMLLASAVAHLNATRMTAANVYGLEPQRIRTAMGTMPIAAKFLGTVDRVINDLAKSSPGSSVVVMPVGVAITFLAGAVNPLWRRQPSGGAFLLAI